MKKVIQSFALPLCTALVVSFAVQSPALPFARWFASFTASPQAWTAAFETNPTASDPVSQADDHLRQIKTEVRDRVETEMDFGSALGNVGTDTGRLLPGAARAFVQAGRPTVDGTLTPNCLAEADRNGNRGCDSGRLSLDTADNSLAVALDAGADGDADSWQRIKIDGTDVTTGTVPPARLNATTTPTANAIPLADGTGKIASGWVTVGAPICYSIGTAPTCVIPAGYTSVTVVYQAYGNGSTGVIGVQTDSDGGTSYDTGGSNYTQIYHRVSIAGSVSTGAGANSYITIAELQLNTERASGVITITDLGGSFSGVTQPRLVADSSSSSWMFHASGTRDNTVSINALRMMSTGSISIAMKVYGNL